MIILLQQDQPMLVQCHFSDKHFFVIEAPLLLGESCIGNSDCAVAHSLCLTVDAATRDLDFTCQCKQSHVNVNESCVAREYLPAHSLITCVIRFFTRKQTDFEHMYIIICVVLKLGQIRFEKQN